MFRKWTDSDEKDTQQSLANSCVPFSFAQLFVKICTDNDDFFASGNLEQILRIFEIGIYPEIWKENGRESDEAKSLQYMMQYLIAPPEIFETKQQISGIKKETDKILFVIEKTKSDELHTVMIFEKNNKWVCEENEYNDFTDIKKDFQKIFSIHLTDLNIALIKDAYKKYEDTIKRVIYEYDENNTLHKYYLSSLAGSPIYKSPLITLYHVGTWDKVFPDLKPIVEKQLLDHPEKFIYNMSEMSKIKARYSDCTASLLKQFSRDPVKYLNDFYDINTALKLFPEMKEEIKKILLADIAKYIKDSCDLETARQIFPECTNELKHSRANLKK